MGEGASDGSANLPTTAAEPVPLVRADADPIREWILSEGGARRIAKVSPVFGGCINSAWRYDTDAGAFFVKTNSSMDASMFSSEARGLESMLGCEAIRVPRPYKSGPLPRRGSFLILEFIEFGSLKGQESLGRQLAQMHLRGKSPNGQFGFFCDNTIGSTPQPNPWSSDWLSFFRFHRLQHQMDLISRQFNDGKLREAGDQLLDRLPDLFAGVSVEPALLHGDLWSGNIAADTAGAAVIFDPAAYYGHNEAEFGMSWCAGFGQSFYLAYFEVIPKQPGFEERVELYKLYHYLNHYNLFGSSYRSSCMSIINRFI